MTLNELYDFADNNNIDVDYFPMRGSVALSTPDGIAIDFDKIEDPKKEKVVLAHELGHCKTGSFYNIHSKFNLKSRYEYKANRWAYKNLLPYKDIVRAIKKEALRNSWELAEYFEVPVEFMNKALEFYENVEQANK